jgi:3-oxoacyl-[acyl-carrier protein] reductase
MNLANDIEREKDKRMKRLTDRVAIVTGAGSGIGKAIAELFASNGAAVSVVDIDQKAISDVATRIQNNGGKAQAIRCDVSQPSDVKSAIQATVQVFGELDIVVNSAGVCPLKPLEEIPFEEWNRVLAINLTGPFLLCQAAFPYLCQAGKKGRIINMGSLAGQIGGIAVGAHYSASKGGLMVLTKQLAKLLAPYRATANNIAPATTDTPMTQSWAEETRQSLIKQFPLGRLGKPEDVANAALFLASDEAEFITGATLNVNGGFFMG